MCSGGSPRTIRRPPPTAPSPTTMTARTGNTGQPTAFINARLVDPEGRYDGPGSLVVRESVIADVVRKPGLGKLSDDVRVIDCNGAMLAPGLIDIRVKTGEPGAERDRVGEAEVKQRRGVVDLPARQDHHDHRHGIDPVNNTYPRRLDHPGGWRCGATIAG